MKRQQMNVTVLAGEAAAPVTYTISGTVYDADGTTAVASVTVAIGTANATSGADGTYTISGLAAGTSGSLTCTKTGYSWTAITVAAMSGNLTSQNFTNVWYAAGGSLASCVIAYKPVGAASLAASLVNLANPGTYDATYNATKDPDFNAATGWRFIAANTDYLLTGYVPPNQVGRSAFVRISSATVDATNRWIFSSINSSAQFGIRITTAGQVPIFYNGTGTGYTHTAITSGVLGVAGLDPYLGGSDLGNITAGTYNQGTSGIEIGRTAQQNSQYYDGYMQAFVVYSATLNSTQVGILSAAMANLA